MISQNKPRYRCVLHDIVKVDNTHYVMDMTVLDEHTPSGSAAGTRGHSSPIVRMDLPDGLIETRNSVYMIVRYEVK